MTSRWGFHRGFGLWREFQESQPEGDCEHLTAAALAWLESRPAEPFFLFLHYYDPHSPYDPPAPYREAFGSSAEWLRQTIIRKAAGENVRLVGQIGEREPCARIVERWI